MENDLYELSARLGGRLKARSLIIATAESCTGGWIAQTITDVPGSSAWFDRGFVTYSNLSKIQLLGVDPEVLADCGAVSREVAQQMLAGVLKNSEADITIAVTGIAGPDGGSDEKPVGTVFIGWQFKGDPPRIDRVLFSGDRREIRTNTVILSISTLLSLLPENT